jgi:hypothetical protein
MSPESLTTFLPDSDVHGLPRAQEGVSQEIELSDRPTQFTGIYIVNTVYLSGVIQTIQICTLSISDNWTRP